ncbi:MAG: cytochrome c biogenesis protein CcdA [Bacteroidales bacterium]
MKYQHKYRYSKVAILFFTLILFLLSLTPAMAQILEPVKWESSQEKVNEDEYNLLVNAIIDDKWYLYGLEIPDGGPIPTSFYLEESDFFELIGTTEETTTPEIKFDPFFEMELPLFSNNAGFLQKIRILTDQEFTITGFVEYMSCDDERCLPPQETEIEYVINAGAGAAVAEAPSETAAMPEAQFTPEETNDTRSLWIFFFIAFAGGLAGLLTPCVFPMIPMTVSFFMQKQSGKMNSIINIIVFAISIIAVYTSLGLLVSLTSVGAGFANQLTSHWLPNIIFFILFLVFAASFFGLFEITIPGSLATKADQKADSGGYIGSFFMALTLVIVSLSCVGPIVGALLVEAASGAGSKPIVGMFGFSLAFAIPFTLLAIFPSWINKLPKSGGWLNSVKVVLGFIVLAFSLRFLMIIDQTYHFGILTRDIYLAIWIVIFTLLGFYLLGKIKFAHDSEVSHISVPRLILAIASFSFVVYLVPGMFGAPLTSISSLLPSPQTHTFDIRGMIRDAEFQGTQAQRTDLCEDPLYADFLHLPHGLRGYFDLEQGLACAREQNKPVFIDFVGHACSNCKEMEAKVWSDPRVLRRLREDYIIIALYVDDRTRLPENQWVTSDFDGRVKSTIGTRNLDYQITNFNTNTQPYYVVMDAGENLLGNPHGYNLNVEAFIEFLDNGLENYNAGLAARAD